MGRRHPERELRRTFGANVRRERKALMLSQEELGEEAGLHRTYIGAIERGEKNVSLDSIEKLATALKYDPWKLLQSCPPDENATRRL
jgi:transcriptional regulator with XRE-family HTH domain